MQNLGDKIANVLSCWMIRGGFDNHPFSYSANDISQHFRCSVAFVGRDICRNIARFRATRLVLNLAIFVPGIVARFVSALDGRMSPVMSIPFTKSVGSCLPS